MGAGKSEILSYLKKQQNIRVMLADEIAHGLMEPGTACYQTIKDHFRGEDIYLPGGGFDRGKLAAVIFADEEKRTRMNEIVHPVTNSGIFIPERISEGSDSSHPEDIQRKRYARSSTVS